MVKIKGKNITIPAGTICNVQYKASMGIFEKKTPMIVEQLEIDLPEDGNIVDSVVAIKKSAANYFQVPVVNHKNMKLLFERITESEHYSTSIP